MLRRSPLVVAVVAALALVPAAVAVGGGPSPGALQGYQGVVSPNGKIRYVAVSTGAGTAVESIETSNGTVLGWGSLPGSFGIPLVTQQGTTGGLSADGRTLVLQDATPTQPRKLSRFVVYDPRALASPGARFDLAGDFSYDALSPDGRTLFLIQHVSQRDLTRYVVRAYDLSTGRLLPRRIADRTQAGWVMQGYPMARATSSGGRFVYTLYQNPGGYPFVHALDTVTRTAHCIGVPWKNLNDQNALWNVQLSLRDGGRSLALTWRSGRPYLAIDTRSYRIAYPQASFPWTALGGGLAGLALLGGLGGAIVLRRRRTPAAAAGDEFAAFLREQEAASREPLAGAGD